MLFLFSHLSFIGFADIKYLKRLVEKMHGQDLYQFIMLLSCRRLLKPSWFFILFYVPLISYYAWFVTGDKLGKGFGKGENSTVWGVIGLLTGLFINMIVHAFGSDQFDSSAVPDETA